MNTETQDFYMSAFLCLNGVDLIGLKEFGQRKLFVFEDTKRFQDLKKKYYWNQASVDPLEFKKEIRRLKSLIFSS